MIRIKEGEPRTKEDIEMFEAIDAFMEEWRKVNNIHSLVQIKNVFYRDLWIAWRAWKR